MPNKKFYKIFIHCSDSEFGTALMIRRWHVLRNFRTIGYHVCVCNGYPTNDWFKKGIKIPFLEGSVETGREIDSDQWFEPFEKGAGVYGYNEGAFHICMIGKKNFTNHVRNRTIEVVKFHSAQFKLDPQTGLFGHCEKDSKKTCPNIDMDEFRKHLEDNTQYGQKKIFSQIVEKVSKEDNLNKTLESDHIEKPTRFNLVNKLFLILGIFSKVRR